MVKSWKDNELKFAKLFGTKRNPYSGSMSHQSTSDTLHEEFYLEVKDGKQSEPTQLWKDTVKKAKEEGKVPMIIQHFKGEKLLDARITMTVGDFLKLAGIEENKGKVNNGTS